MKQLDHYRDLHRAGGVKGVVRMKRPRHLPVHGLKRNPDISAALLDAPLQTDSDVLIDRQSFNRRNANGG
jgi:hypothetical protein